MATEDKSQLPPLSSEDEKEAQKESDRLGEKQNGAFNTTHKRTGFEDKTLWDWLQLLGILAIPLVVAGATILFGIQQANLANQQHDSDQHRATDQQQAIILQTYIDNIQDLLLNHNLLGDNPKPKNDADNAKIQEVQELARARTLTALPVLDPERKGRLVQFLHEAQLIGYADFDDYGAIKKTYASIINLTTADLSGAYFHGVDLDAADLSYVDLSGADLHGILLAAANLIAANLRGANLSYTLQLHFLSTALMVLKKEKKTLESFS